MFDFKSEESISILVATRLRVMSQHLCVGPPGCEETESFKFSAGRLLKYSGFRILHETYVLKLYTRARDVITLQSLCWPLFAMILGHLVFNISQSKNIILLLLRLGDPSRLPFDPCLKSSFLLLLFSPLCVNA